MNKLITTFMLLFSLISLAQTCPEGDINCTSSSPGGAGVHALGIDCPGCHELEISQAKTILDTSTVFRPNNTPVGTTPATTVDTGQ